MGGGTQAAISLSEQLEKFAKSTGQNANAVFTQFNSQLDRFSVLSSEKAVASFERIQMAAKRTGQPIGDVFNAVAKFDDIETGFQAGGQLNRVLSFMGGSFDTFKAMQATDEERAKMLYEAISGVGDKYSQLQTDQAKRAFATQLAKESGIDMRTVVGLLNKSTDLSKDIADISKKPLITEGFTDKERTETMVGLTTSKEFGEARDRLLEAGKAAQTLANNLRDADRVRGEQASIFYKGLDEKLLAPILSGNIENVKKLFDDYKKTAMEGIKEVLTDPSKAFKDAATAINTAADKFSNVKLPQATYANMSSSPQNKSVMVP